MKRCRVYHFEVFKRVVEYAKKRVCTSPFIVFKSREIIWNEVLVVHIYIKVCYSGPEITEKPPTGFDNNCLFVMRFDLHAVWGYAVKTIAFCDVHHYSTVRIIDDIHIQVPRHDSLRKWK